MLNPHPKPSKWDVACWIAGLVVFLLICYWAVFGTRPANAQSVASPPSISQSVQEAITVNQIMAIIAERDRQYAQRFDAQEKSTIVALAAAEKAVQAALIAAKEAVQKAEVASEKRFDSVNEFRNTLKDQQLLLMTRVEAEARFKDMDRRILENAQQVADRASEARGAAVLWGYIAGAVGLFIGIGSLLFAFRRTAVRLK